MDMHLNSTFLIPRRSSDRRRPGSCEATDFSCVSRRSERSRQTQAGFEIRNSIGRMTHGIEIELSGLREEDVFRAYYLNRHGMPDVTRTRTSIRVRLETLRRSAVHSLSQTNIVRNETAARPSQPFMWEFALFGGGGSERFCLEMSTLEVIATYRWLVAADSTSRILVLESTPAFTHDSRSGE
ncbi:MAG: hypothetical protein IPP88_20620 [Betaproteobacteria bacterium]|nr:hypothetical protein [Betaproteobacteria bacterium]